jgi:alpha-1,3-rhamnosyl/mannosyltransferase
MERLEALGVQHIIRGPNPRLQRLKLPRALIYAALEEGSLRRWAEKAGADAVFYPADTGALLSHGSLPVITTIHGIASHHTRGIRTPRDEAVWRARVRRAAAVSQQIITVSASSARDLREVFGIESTRLEVIPHGIDHDRFHPTAALDEASRLKARYALPERFALYLGNLEPRKNILALLDAFEDDRISAFDLPLVVAGRPAWSAEPILERLKATRNASYIGPVDSSDVAPLYRASSMFVFPSLYEGFGFPVLEAMACGVPVLCSNRGSLRDVASSGAYLLEDVSSSGIARGIAEMMSDDVLREELASAGRQHALKFQWQQSAEAHLSLFENVVARHGRAPK